MKAQGMSAVILAGGKSSRMGKNKLLLSLGDMPLIGHLIHTVTGMFTECIVVTDTPEAYAQYPVRLTQDIIICAEKNSLTGIHAGLTAAKHDYSLVIGGDMPFVQASVLEHLCRCAEGYDVAIIRDGPHFQPLCAVYHKNCLPHIEALLRAGRFKILGFFPHVRVRFVEMGDILPLDPEGITFFNVNTPGDYARALAFLAEKKEE